MLQHLCTHKESPPLLTSNEVIIFKVFLQRASIVPEAKYLDLQIYLKKVDILGYFDFFLVILTLLEEKTSYSPLKALSEKPL